MSDPDIEREEDANAARRAQGDATAGDRGALGTIERAFKSVLAPLTRSADSEADIESRRSTNDAEERA